MIGYTTLGTNDLEKSSRFYDALFAVCGASRILDMGTFILWGTSLEESALAIAKPFDGNEATVGNGVMVAIRAKSEEEVNAIYDKAIELGGSDEGAPGQRGDGFYAGYFRDLEGNKLNAFFTG
ncbi:VOC family protein [Thalassomonas viridans]|uniref:VOC family protein n=1 Tax=Thalassomonas viridans TaxID=137584 RepID=A0AAE9Z484_9GAMM|nr:VOC family protein [Thalassomonas viridans]WDE06471.1 VOC family protein [Thalassomonas viridans]